MPTSGKTSHRSSWLRPVAVALVGATAAASLTLVSTASAGIIPSDGWNLDNVTVTLDGTGSTFDPITGDYFFGPDSDYSYQADVDNGAGEVLGIVLAKNWPIGEPPGIKIVNDDFEVRQEGRPTNCIMATSYLDGAFLDSTDPQQVLCSGPFQSHKRFKLAMLPTAVDGGAGSEEGIDLVFDVDPEAGTRDYQVFQKINNWTDGRLDGFTIEVGTGIGANFVPASDPDNGVGVENLSLSVPLDFFDSDQLATFSQGLFGPVDTQHDRPAGFFDQDTRAGFTIAEYPNESGETDTLTSGAPLGSDYGQLFGPWLPNNMLPTGIFFDDDGNPDTDAQLVAWYGFNPVLGALGWMTGAADGFAAIPDETIEAWGQNLEYTAGVIDDLVNVGLNYIVTVGDTASFTVRVTPSVDESGAGVPAFVGAPVTPPLVFGSSDGVVSISPAPTFPVGAVVTARVGDADLNADPQAIDEVDVNITVDGGVPEVLTLVELGPDRGVFAAILPAVSSSDLPAGAVVTATYVDANDGLGGIDVVKSVSTTATDGVPPTATTWPDFDGDGMADRSVFRPEAGGWYVDGQTTVFHGLAADVPVPADYDGDGVTDRAVFREGAWYIEGQATRFVGFAGDVPVPGDYDGDGDWEPAVFRDGAWFIEGQATQYLGATSDVPVPGDYDGDGITEVAVFRPSVGGWYVDGETTVFYGLSTDVPVPADYNGDGTTDRAVFRPDAGGWYVDGLTTEFVGLSTDVPVPADYDGDGSTERAVYRPQAGGWFVQGETPVFYGLPTDVPLPLPAAVYNTYFTVV